MPRSPAGRDFGERRVIRRERALLAVELVDHDLVEPEVGGEGEAVAASRLIE
jgi:hypothetical protein